MSPQFPGSLARLSESSLHLSESSYVCFLFSIKFLPILSGTNREKYFYPILPEAGNLPFLLKLFLPSCTSVLFLPPFFKDLFIHENNE